MRASTTRTRALRSHGIALWDVLKSCTRSSSLDSDIVESSIVVNPLAEFLLAHPGIRAVCFNGAKAEATFRRHVLANLAQGDPPELFRLPSTSPANASISYARKLEDWAVVRELLVRPCALEHAESRT